MVNKKENYQETTLVSSKETQGSKPNPLVQLDPGLFIWTILTFLLLCFALAKFAWKPLLKAVMGLFVKPFALTMRLAANMTGGHIALLALLSLMAIFGELFSSAVAGIGVSIVAVPMAAAIAGLEVIVVLVQAYVFTLLTAVFIGMAIHVHH